ncbi:asparagine synthase-related protein [Maribellus mangrovi]|uniref:asparagine synthase-related protein n=1 Tax=Maribellus mangrovi TaxID=3133146 RepID=UPI0030EB39D0
MIYGCLSGSRHSLIETKIELLEQLMKFDDFYHQRKTDGNFFAGYYVSKKIPLSKNDFFFNDPNTGNTLLLSGCIYNIDTIIESYGISGKTISTAEKLYVAYRNGGLGFVNQLNGDFVFAIFLKKSHKLFLFRDHLGIRPLAYTKYNDNLFFSSDITSLCRSFYEGDKLNREFLLNEFKMIDFSQTPNSAVKKLPPGHYLEFSKNSVKTIKYWHPEKIQIDNNLGKVQMLSDIEKIIDNAVAIRCNPKYTAGTHISGGLDSGIVAALAKKYYQHQKIFYGFSWSPSELNNKSGKYDERELIREQCKLNEITPYFAKWSFTDFRHFVSNKLRFGEFYQEYKVLQKAETEGVNLIFSGYGGDEFVSKGDRGIDMDLLFNLQFSSFLQRNSIAKPRSLFKRIINEILFPALNILPLSVRKLQKESSKYIKAEYQKSDKKTVSNFYFFTSRRKLHLGFLKTYHLNYRLENWYIEGMHKGIEYRFPLLDKNIVEYMLKVPSKLLANSNFSRTILREISDGFLPESVRWNLSSFDPVLYQESPKMVNKLSLEIINELPSIEQNSELSFIDFKKIKKDIIQFNKNPDYNSFSYLLLALFFAKQLHEYTIQYKKVPAL